MRGVPLLRSQYFKDRMCDPALTDARRLVLCDVLLFRAQAAASDTCASACDDCEDGTRMAVSVPVSYSTPGTLLASRAVRMKDLRTANLLSMSRIPVLVALFTF